jgi:hypothetical protein
MLVDSAPRLALMLDARARTQIQELLRFSQLPQ